MVGVKRRRNTLKLHDEKKKKKSVSRPSSIFEDLSNELIYEMFDYLDGCENYQVFSTLNARFQSLLTNSCFRFKLNLPFTSRSDILHSCRQIVAPNVDRIVSIYSSHCLTTDVLLGLFQINSFIRLEALTLNLNSAESSIIDPLFTGLDSLPRLCYLSLLFSDYLRDENEVYKRILRLRVLKYCKLKFFMGGDLLPLAYAIDEQDQCKTLEHFIIDGNCRLDQLSAILTYTPRLKYLSCRIRRGFETTEIKLPILSINLTRAYLDCHDISFDEFEIFLSKISQQLKILRVTTDGSTTFLRAARWEQLILSHMPQLRVFDFQHRVYPDEFVDDEQAFVDIEPLYRFQSPFWLDRRWFFDLQVWYRDTGEYDVFYSSSPYRRKNYELYQNENSDNDFTAVRDLTIGGRPLVDSDDPFLFPNVTKLTLRDSKIERNPQFFREIDSIIPLAQLNQLVMDDQRLSIAQLVELLQNAPNIQSLRLSDVPCLEKQTHEIVRNIRQLSKNNKITKLIIEDDCTLEQVQFFVKLCPQLQYLEMGIYGTQLNSILRFLMKNKATKVPHLFALCLLNLPCDEMERIQALLDCEKLLHDYSIHSSNTDLYLWW